jgi:hypothetical protein
MLLQGHELGDRYIQRVLHDPEAQRRQNSVIPTRLLWPYSAQALEMLLQGHELGDRYVQRVLHDLQTRNLKKLRMGRLRCPHTLYLVGQPGKHESRADTYGESSMVDRVTWCRIQREYSEWLVRSCAWADSAAHTHSTSWDSRVSYL